MKSLFKVQANIPHDKPIDIDTFTMQKARNSGISVQNHDQPI